MENLLYFLIMFAIEKFDVTQMRILSSSVMVVVLLPITKVCTPIYWKIISYMVYNKLCMYFLIMFAIEKFDVKQMRILSSSIMVVVLLPITKVCTPIYWKIISYMVYNKLCMYCIICSIYMYMCIYIYIHIYIDVIYTI